MKTSIKIKAIITLFAVLTLTACDKSSSPEGRMNMKLDALQQEMFDTLKQQNQAILDSLGKIRQDLNELKQQKK